MMHHKDILKAVGLSAKMWYTPNKTINRINNMNKEEVYQISDQGLAAYLLSLGFLCIGAIPAGDKNDSNRMNFVFLDVEQPSVLYQDYMENKAEGKLYEFRSNLIKLRRMLRENVITEADIEEMRK